MNLSGCAKFLIGFILAIAIMIGGGVLASFYFMAKLTQPPPKPIFANDPEAKVSPAASPSPKASGQPSQSPTPSPIPKSSQSPASKPLEPGSYKARVTWSKGLVLRGGPSINAERVGGLAYNETIVVLEQSPDKQWQRVRTENGNRKGWIKSGNIKKIDE